MSEERKTEILVTTGVGAIFLVIVMLTVFLIDNYSAEIISLFMQMLFISCFLVASYIVGLVILKIFRKWKWLINFQSKKFIEDEKEEELAWLFIVKEESMKLLELQKKEKTVRLKFLKFRLRKGKMKMKRNNIKEIIENMKRTNTKEIICNILERIFVVVFSSLAIWSLYIAFSDCATGF